MGSILYLAGCCGKNLAASLSVYSIVHSIITWCYCVRRCGTVLLTPKPVCFNSFSELYAVILFLQYSITIIATTGSSNPQSPVKGSPCEYRQDIAVPPISSASSMGLVVYIYFLLTNFATRARRPYVSSTVHAVIKKLLFLDGDTYTRGHIPIDFTYLGVMCSTNLLFRLVGCGGRRALLRRNTWKCVMIQGWP